MSEPLPTPRCECGQRMPLGAPMCRDCYREWTDDPTVRPVTIDEEMDDPRHGQALDINSRTIWG